MQKSTRIISRETKHKDKNKSLTNKPPYIIPLSHSFGVLQTDGPALQV